MHLPLSASLSLPPTLSLSLIIVWQIYSNLHGFQLSTSRCFSSSFPCAGVLWEWTPIWERERKRESWVQCLSSHPFEREREGDLSSVLIITIILCLHAWRRASFAASSCRRRLMLQLQAAMTKAREPSISPGVSSAHFSHSVNPNLSSFFFLFFSHRITESEICIGTVMLLLVLLSSVDVFVWLGGYLYIYHSLEFFFLLPISLCRSWLWRLPIWLI